MGLNDKETEYFWTLIQLESTRNPAAQNSLRDKLQLLGARDQVRDLSLEAFKVISEWYHIPIIEMTEVTGFDFNAKNIAGRLGISVFQAEAAVERLLRLELIEQKQDGKFKKTYNEGLFRSEVASQALRHFHKQMLERAIDSLETQSSQEKWVGCETFAFDPTKLPKANLIIREFIRKMNKLAKSSQQRSCAYHLGIQLFNLTKGEDR